LTIFYKKSGYIVWDISQFCGICGRICDISQNGRKSNMDMRAKTCCFTGHRSLNGAEKLKVVVRLRKVIRELVKQGIAFLGAGGALGFDTLAAQTILDMKKEYPQLRLILVLPCEDQTRGWRSEDIAVYEDIKRRSDKVVYVSREYTPDCMHRRNRHLVDHSGICICYLTRNSGGTAYTVDYARRKGLCVINIARSI
jgi:uncharacterized phage-like protein YoqJ